MPGRAAPGEAESDDPERRRKAAAAVVAAALNAAQSPPFMTATPRRRGPRGREPRAGDAAPLVAYLAGPLDTTALVLVVGGGATPEDLAKALKAREGRQGRARPPRRRATCSRSTSPTPGSSSAPTRPSTWRPTWARMPAACRSSSRCSRAAFGPGATLDVDDVEPYLGDAGSVPNYQLTNAIEAGDIAGALATLRRLLTAPGTGSRGRCTRCR